MTPGLIGMNCKKRENTDAVPPCSTGEYMSVSTINSAADQKPDAGLKGSQPAHLRFLKIMLFIMFVNINVFVKIIMSMKIMKSIKIMMVVIITINREWVVTVARCICDERFHQI